MGIKLAGLIRKCDFLISAKRVMTLIDLHEKMKLKNGRAMTKNMLSVLLFVRLGQVFQLLILMMKKMFDELSKQGGYALCMSRDYNI
jgi:hypothetical protein